MICSRDLSLLHPIVRTKAEGFLALCAIAGLDIVVSCTLRDGEYQSWLYAQGRTRPGKIVTKARAGYSYHEYAMAFDAYPKRMGKLVTLTGHPDWAVMGRLAKVVGLDWGGSWVGFKDFPHFQYTGGLTLAQLRAGKRLQSISNRR